MLEEKVGQKGIQSITVTETTFVGVPIELLNLLIVVFAVLY